MTDRDPVKGIDRSEGDVNLSPYRQRWDAEQTDEATRRQVDADADVFLHQSLSTPCLNALSACEGIYLEDVAGRRYMDFHGNNVHQVGFKNQRVVDAVKQQLDLMPFCTRRYANETATRLASKLVQLAPGGLGRVLFCPGGTSAIGIALKLARLATGRHKTISMWDSFHGASLDAISVGGEATFRAGIGPLLPGGQNVPPADSYRCLWDCRSRGGCDLKCADYLEYVLDHERDVAAVVAEPVRSTPTIPSTEYWKRIRQVCDRYGTLLIFDEVCHGLGRTGRMFVCEHFDVVPDLLVLGKGLGGGVLPLAAVLAREEFNDVAKTHALGHYTHEKSPVACSAGLATLEEIEERGLVEHAAKVGAFAVQRLLEMQSRCELIGDVRGIGLLIGVELVSDRETRSRAVDQAEQVMYECLRRGLSFKLTMGNIITLTPPLMITETEMGQALDILEASLLDVSSQTERES